MRILNYVWYWYEDRTFLLRWQGGLSHESWFIFLFMICWSLNTFTYLVCFAISRLIAWFEWFFFWYNYRLNSPFVFFFKNITFTYRLVLSFIQIFIRSWIFNYWGLLSSFWSLWCSINISLSIVINHRRLLW